MTAFPVPRRLILLWSLITLGWLVLAPAVHQPTDFQPWAFSIDLSFGPDVKDLGEGWRIRRDGHPPNVVDTALIDRGSLAFQAPSADGALLRLKAQVPEAAQRLTVRLNGAPLDTLIPTKPGRTETWLRIIPPGRLQPGANLVTLENSDPSRPIPFEKLVVGNVRKSYAAWQLVSVPDAAVPRHGAKTPWPLILIGLAIWGAFSTFIAVLCLTGKLSWSIAGWSLLPPGILVISTLGLAIGGLVSPYRILLNESALGGYWLIAIWTSLGSVGFWVLPSAGNAALTGLGRAANHEPAIAYGGALLALGIVAIALGLRVQEVARAPAAIIQWFGHQNDEELFLNSAVAIAHLDWRTLLKPSLDFPLLGPGWGFYCPVGLALALGGLCMKAWGLYPGLAYWLWTLVVGGALLCLVPYGWQRLWGYPGVGGLLAGALLAVSPGLRALIPQMVSDNQAYLFLGGALIWLARLATRERWRDAAILGALMAGLGATRFLMLPILMVMMAVLAGIWWITADSPARRVRRAAQWGAACGLTVLLLWLMEWTLLHGYGGGRESFFLSQVPKAGSDALFSSKQLANIRELLPMFLTDLGREHPVWIGLWFALLPVGWWCLRRARASMHWQPFLLLAAPLVVYTLEAVSRWIYATRYIYPTLILEAVLLAFIIDLVWLQLQAGIRRIPLMRAQSLGAAALVLLIIAPLTVVAETSGQIMLGQWRQLRQAGAARLAYLSWARAQLPPNAVVLLDESDNPWETVRYAWRTTLFPITIGGSYRNKALVFEPQEVGRHPFRVINYRRTAWITAVPGVPVTTHSSLTPAEIEGLVRNRFAPALIDDLLARGRAVCVLDPSGNAPLPRHLLEENETGRYNSFSPGRYHIVAHAGPAAPNSRPWIWYQVSAPGRSR